jgi:hypothetical protein
VLVLFVFGPVLAQDKTAARGNRHRSPQQRDPILVHVTNLTTTTIELAFPLYSVSRGRYQAAPAEPVGIERRKRLGWEEIPSALHGRVLRASPQIAPGETNEYEIGVPDAGDISCSDLVRGLASTAGTTCAFCSVTQCGFCGVPSEVGACETRR